MWYYLRGYEIPDQETTRSSIGHNHVLAPEMRPPAQAWHIARRLTVKATARLRRMDYYAGAFSLSMRLENGPRLGLEARCPHAQDSFAFLQILEEMWRALMHEAIRHYNPLWTLRSKAFFETIFLTDLESRPSQN